MWKGKAYIIDVAQAVPLDHPMSEEFFLRDVRNIVRYFRGQGVKLDEKGVLKRIRGA